MKEKNIKENIQILIDKGGQEELKAFIDNNTIFYYDEDTHSFEEEQEEFFLQFLYMNSLLDIGNSWYYEDFHKANQCIHQYENDEHKKEFKYNKIHAFDLITKKPEDYSDWVEKAVFPEKIKALKCYIL